MVASCHFTAGSHRWRACLCTPLAHCAFDFSLWFFFNHGTEKGAWRGTLILQQEKVVDWRHKNWEHDVYPNGFSICCSQMWNGKPERLCAGLNPYIQPFLWGCNLYADTCQPAFWWFDPVISSEWACKNIMLTGPQGMFTSYFGEFAPVGLARLVRWEWCHLNMDGTKVTQSSSMSSSLGVVRCVARLIIGLQMLKSQKAQDITGIIHSKSSDSIQRWVFWKFCQCLNQSDDCWCNVVPDLQYRGTLIICPSVPQNDTSFTG